MLLCCDFQSEIELQISVILARELISRHGFRIVNSCRYVLSYCSYNLRYAEYLGQAP